MTKDQIRELATECVETMGDIFHDHDPDAGESDPAITATQQVEHYIGKAIADPCPVCNGQHFPCIQCDAPTRCDTDEPGEQFTLCDACDAVNANPELTRHVEG